MDATSLSITNATDTVQESSTEHPFPLIHSFLVTPFFSALSLIHPQRAGKNCIFLALILVPYFLSEMLANSGVKGTFCMQNTTQDSLCHFYVS